MTGTDDQAPKTENEEVQIAPYPFPSGNPSWARTAPSAWTDQQRKAAGKFWEENVRGIFNVDLTTYGQLAADREPPSDADIKAVAAQRQRERRARLKAAEAATPPGPETAGGRGRKPLAIQERKARDAERQRERRRMMKEGGTGGKAVVAEVTPMSPADALTQPFASVSAQGTGTYTIALTVDADVHEVLKSVALVRSFSGPALSVSAIMEEIVRGALPGLKGELRKLREALAVVAEPAP